MQQATYILMASVSKDNHGKAAQDCYRPLRPDVSDFASVLHSVSFDKMSNDQNDQVSNGDQCNHARVFEGVQAP